MDTGGAVQGMCKGQAAVVHIAAAVPRDTLSMRAHKGARLKALAAK